MSNNEITERMPKDQLDLTLLSNFIHQVVNPLNGIAGTLDNLIEGRISGWSRQLQRLKATRAQLEECISLLRNLAFFAQGFSPIDVTQTDAVVIPEIIIQAAMFFQEEAANRKMTIDLTDPRTQNKVRGHSELLRQVFMNMFDNAVKYGQSESKVTIEQRVQAKTGDVLITISSQSREPISQDDLRKVFELGFRGQNAKKIIASGTGIGLFICKRIIEDVHGGRLWAEASRSGAVIFRMTIPIEQKR